MSSLCGNNVLFDDCVDFVLFNLVFVSGGFVVVGGGGDVSIAE